MTDPRPGVFLCARARLIYWDQSDQDMKRAVIALLLRGTVYIEFERMRNWGECDHELKIFTIKRSLSERNQVRVLIHESLHYLRRSWDEVYVREREDEIFRSLTEEEYGFFVEHLRIAILRERRPALP